MCRARRVKRINIIFIILIIIDCYELYVVYYIRHTVYVYNGMTDSLLLLNENYATITTT